MISTFLIVSTSKVLYKVECVQKAENRWFLHFDCGDVFRLEIVRLLIVSAYHLKAFPRPQSAPSHVQGLRKCRLDVQEMFTPPMVSEHICQATLPDQSRRFGPTLFQIVVAKKNIHIWSLYIAYHV